MLTCSFVKILSGVALEWFELKNSRSKFYLYEEDVTGDDPISLPEGKVIQVTFEFVDDPNEEKLNED